MNRSPPNSSTPKLVSVDQAGMVDALSGFSIAGADINNLFVKRVDLNVDNLNATIAELQSENQSLKKEVGELRDAINTIAEHVDNLERYVGLVN